MQISLLGGTGDIGEGLALRLARDTDHDIHIGSREASKAANAAARYERQLSEYGVETTLGSGTNSSVTTTADVAILAVPAYYLADTIAAVEDELDGTVLVSPAVGMKRDDAGIHYNPPGVGSVTELAARAAPDDVPVVGAFHNLAAGRLTSLEADLDWDVLVVGDDPDAKALVRELTDDIAGLRSLDVGGLANAAEVESVTPLLINLAANNDDLSDLGVKFW